MLFSKIWSFVWLVSLCVLGQNSKPQKCKEAQEDCNYYTKCAGTLSWMFRTCKESLAYDALGNKITGPTPHSCSLACVYAIGNLTAIERGRNLETCECGVDAMCLTVKARMKKCVDQASGRYNSTIQGCTEARKICSNDTKCLEMQREFLQKCTKMIDGIECTDDCKESRDRFLNSKLGKTMKECECDGYEETYCHGIRAHHNSLCVKDDPRRSVTDQPTTRKPVGLSSGQNKMTLISRGFVYVSTFMATFVGLHR